jgi:DNA-binding response OmpR family regulator
VGILQFGDSIRREPLSAFRAIDRFSRRRVCLERRADPRFTNMKLRRSANNPRMRSKGIVLVGDDKTNRGVTPTMILGRRNFLRVHVVDGRPHDYADLAQPVDGIELRLQMFVFATGREALRSDPIELPNLWVVNRRLPDMSGTDLVSMLRRRHPGVPIAMVSDECDPSVEGIARASSPDIYFSKPLETEWLAASCVFAR